MRLLLTLLVLGTLACATSTGSSQAPSHGEGAQAEQAPGDRCDPPCKKNLLCRNGECMFEPTNCSDDSGCPSPYVCREGLCKLPGGASCRYASQCASSKCVWGICVIQAGGADPSGSPDVPR